MNLPLQRPEPAPGAQELAPRATESSGAGALHGPGTVAWSGSQTSQISEQVSLLDSSACRTGQPFESPDRSACWTGQRAGRVSPPGQVSFPDRPASWTDQPDWTGQSPRQVSLAARSTSQTGHPFRQISLTNMSTSLISLLDRAAFQTGQSPRQVSFLDRSASQTCHLPGQVSLQTSLVLVSLPDGAAFRQICVSFPDRWAYNTGQQVRLVSQQ